MNELGILASWPVKAGPPSSWRVRAVARRYFETWCTSDLAMRCNPVVRVIVRVAAAKFSRER